MRLQLSEQQGGRWQSAMTAVAARAWAAGVLGWEQGRAQRGTGIAGSHIMQAELSCLQIESRGDLVGERAERTAFRARDTRAGFRAGGFGAIPCRKKNKNKKPPSTPQHTS